MIIQKDAVKEALIANQTEQINYLKKLVGFQDEKITALEQSLQMSENQKGQAVEMLKTAHTAILKSEEEKKARPANPLSTQPNMRNLQTQLKR